MPLANQESFIERVALRQYEMLPNLMELQRYVEHHIPTGSFLKAIITNDLKEACGRADSNNIPLLHLYVKFLYNECPASCWGSKEHYNAWIASAPTESDGDPDTEPCSDCNPNGRDSPTDFNFPNCIRCFGSGWINK